ncbi:TPM domain-containing protein [Methylocapsa acidiphila]|uniref:TPM domain-containing protein n=1 Tax=Methylocapsa acidiphila TaxID=133552 RepID=UPI00047E5FA4|nr:TPM domain-containing protein [Methylocapsa acidiphila]
MRPVRRALALCAAAVAFLAAVGLAFAYDFPPLSGRVVDQAGVIPAATRSALDGKLAELEAKSGIQLVVATVNSLEGDEIEPYANALFRAWKLGEAKKNNGALILVAPKEHRVRIEVGYGLEGTLTDALSKIIISNAMAPRFKAGNYGGGIARGVDDVITVLTTDSSEWQKRPELRVDRQDAQLDRIAPWIALALFALIVFLLFRSPNLGAYRARGPRWDGRQGDFGAPSRSRWGTPPRDARSDAWSEPPPQQQRSTIGDFLSFLLWILMNSGGRGGGDWGGGSSGGGFSGGGGSSGGGGASGSW